MNSDEYMTLDECFAAVEDRDSFFDFVRALVNDRAEEVEKEKRSPSSPYGPGTNGWEHGAIEDYLDACLRCAEDGDSMPKEPSWKGFARFLYWGKTYE